MLSVTEVLVEVPIESVIRQSDMPQKQQEQFVNMLAYFTPEELEDLRDIL